VSRPPRARDVIDVAEPGVDEDLDVGAAGLAGCSGERDVAVGVAPERAPASRSPCSMRSIISLRVSSMTPFKFFFRVPLDFIFFSLNS